MTNNALKRDNSEVVFSETFSRALVGSAPVGLFVANAQGTPTFVNAKWSELSAMTLISLRKNDWTVAVHPDDRANVFKAWNAFIKENEPFALEFRYKRPDEKESWISASATRLRDENGQQSGFLRVEQDLTERKLAENERLVLIKNLKLAEIRLKRSVRARDEFIRICSHELKTPLSSLRLQFQMAQTRIERKDLKVYSKEAVEKRVGLVLRQLDRMGKLIEDMLDVSRVETGQLLNKPSEFNFTTIVNESVVRFSDLFESMHIDVTFEGPPENIMLRGDPYRIEQVVTNLIMNAIKYGAGRPIRIELFQTNKSAHFIVQDQGIGIAEKNIEKIFDRYERAVTSNNISGLGLGLYIAKQIVTAHGGDIFVESKKNEGSRFTVELPLKLNGQFVDEI